MAEGRSSLLKLGAGQKLGAGKGGASVTGVGKVDLSRGLDLGKERDGDDLKS